MIRTLLELKIQRYLDDGLPLPWWLAALMRHDHKLRRFVDQFQALDESLLLSAAARRDTLADTYDDATVPMWDVTAKPTRVESVPHESNRSPVAWTFCSVAAATLLIAAFTVHSNHQQQENAARAQALSQHLTAVPYEMQELLAMAAETSQSGLSHYGPTSVISQEQLVHVLSRVTAPLDRQAELVSPWLSEFSNLGQRVRSQLREQDPREQLFREKSS